MPFMQILKSLMITTAVCMKKRTVINLISIYAINFPNNFLNATYFNFVSMPK